MSIRSSGYLARTRSIARGTITCEIDGTDPMRSASVAPIDCANLIVTGSLLTGAS